MEEEAVREQKAALVGLVLMVERAVRESVTRTAASPAMAATGEMVEKVGKVGREEEVESAAFLVSVSR